MRPTEPQGGKRNEEEGDANRESNADTLLEIQLAPKLLWIRL